LHSFNQYVVFNSDRNSIDRWELLVCKNQSQFKIICARSILYLLFSILTCAASASLNIRSVSL
jgi:hypothetical protein